MTDNKENEYDYGVIKVTTYEKNPDGPGLKFIEKVIDKGIRISLVQKVRNMAGDSFWQVQILYKDNDNKPQCDLYELGKQSILIRHAGQMQIEL